MQNLTPLKIKHAKLDSSQKKHAKLDSSQKKHAKLDSSQNKTCTFTKVNNIKIDSTIAGSMNACS
jgi:hypothetical protein